MSSEWDNGQHTIEGAGLREVRTSHKLRTFLENLGLHGWRKSKRFHDFQKLMTALKVFGFPRNRITSTEELPRNTGDASDGSVHVPQDSGAVRLLGKSIISEHYKKCPPLVLILILRALNVASCSSLNICV